MANYFENSLTELAARNASVETDFKRIDATQFTAIAYKSGHERTRCLVRLGA